MASGAKIQFAINDNCSADTGSQEDPKHVFVSSCCSEFVLRVESCIYIVRKSDVCVCDLRQGMI